MQKKTRRGKGVAVRSEGNAEVVGDDRPRKEVPPISEDARSREHIGTRLQSVADYAKFATAAGIDIYDGEPLARFREVGKMDDRFLRMKEQEIQREILIRDMDESNRAKRLEGK